MDDSYPDSEAITKSISLKHLQTPVHCYDEVDSTMEEAWRISERKDTSRSLGQVIVADRQTEGRGRHGREWHSPEGGGIWVSTLLKPKLPGQHLYPHLTVVSALAVVEAVQSETDTDPRIRWPNDVVYDSSSENGVVRKFSGVLVETKQLGNTRRPRAVVGCGINVNIPADEFPKELKDEATSIQAESGQEHSRTDLLREYLQNFDQKLGQLYRHKHAEIDEEWSSHSAVLNKRVKIRAEERLITGTVKDVSLENGLTLQMDEGGYRIFEPSHVEQLRLVPMKPASGRT